MDFSEEDTFRRLSRRPIEEVYEHIFKKIALGFIRERRDLERYLKEAGYTIEEYNEYDKSGNF